MRLLTSEEHNLLERILGSTQEGVRASMTILLKDYYGEENVIANDDYIIAMGNIPIGIVAHMDTVHKIPVKDLFYDRDKNVLWSPQGLGADDRAGVYGMVEILRRGYRPTLILTTDEEIGALGASALIGDYPQPPCDLNFLIELDRRGEDDCVFYDCDNNDFEIYIEDFGFKTQWGSFSDISYICPTWKIAGVNLSIGYQDEHSYSERLYVDYMFNTIDKVCNIFEALDVEKDKFIYIQSPSYQSWDYGYGNYGYGDGLGDISRAYGYDTSAYANKEEVCWGCVGVFSKSEVVVVKEEHDAVYCEDCYSKRYTRCIDCGTEFLDQHKVHLKCEKCREEKTA